MIVIGMEILLSIVLGITFLMSAVPKLRHPKGFVLAVLEYRLLPPRLSWFYGRLVPPLELLLALLLLTGTALRLAAIVTSVLLLSFIMAVGVNLARGRDLDCHCFGKAIRRPIGWNLLFQDAALFGSAIAVAVISTEWVTAEPWSVFRLSGLVPVGNPMPLLTCMVATALIVALLSRLTDSRKRYERGVISNNKNDKRKAEST